MKEDDDDIQDYVSTGWRKKEIAMQQMTRIQMSSTKWHCAMCWTKRAIKRS